MANLNINIQQVMICLNKVIKPGIKDPFMGNACFDNDNEGERDIMLTSRNRKLNNIISELEVIG
jgi:hypothetical protein